MHARQRVDQRGLAGIGAAGEGDFGQIRRRQLLEFRHAEPELRRPGK
jgi:hypothetical protein